MKNGNLIVIEGACDGIGKTTQYAMLCEHLKNDGEKVSDHHFPSYGLSQAAPVEHYLNGDYGNVSDMPPYLINSFYASDRGVTWYTKLKDLYEKGDILLLDRYTTSSLIYQAALIENLDERKRFVDYVMDFEYNKIGIKEPDNVIFLHAPFDLVTKIRNARKTNDGILNDLHERDLKYMRKVYENAMFLADYLSWNKIRCAENNKMRTINDIHNDVYTLVKKKIK